MYQMERSVQYIGRREQQDLLRQYSRAITTEPRCYVLYFEANGGLGKTIMLQKYPDLVKDVVPNICSSEIVDFYSFENRSAETIERQLIEGLKKNNEQQWYRWDAEVVDTAFATYEQLILSYQQERISGDQQKAQDIQTTLRTTFSQAWNSLAQKRPMVMLFDTLETLFTTGIPDEALVSQESRSAELVRDWMRSTLPNLAHTLVILSGRPLKLPSHPLIDDLSTLLPVPPQQLIQFNDPRDIIEYLKVYGVNIELSDVPQIVKITGGRPLLLTCFAETKRQENAIPPGFIPRKAFTTRSQFEEALIDTILNPRLKSRIPSSSESAKLTLLYSLYFLACARRGIHRKDLRVLFEVNDLPEADEEVIQHLHEVALVKTIQRQPLPPLSGSLESSIGESQLPADNEVLLLHDEIYLLIDNSNQIKRLGIDTDTLKYLCDVSREEVRTINRQQSRNNRTQLLQAMSDHMYYELTRDPAHGYRIYTVYSDRLLRERDSDGVLLLSNALWSTLLYTVDLHDQNNPAQQKQHPLIERLIETQGLQGGPLVTQAEILRDERVRKIKLDNARDQNKEAHALASQIYKQFVADSLILADDQTPSATNLPIDQYLFVDLTLARINALIQVRSRQDEPLLNRLFDNVLLLLEHPGWINEEFLLMRRLFLLGETYKMRGFLRRQQQLYADAEEDANKARIAYKEYLELSQPTNVHGYNPIADLNDFIIDELAQVTNNLTYNLVQKGDFRRALHFSNETIQQYIPFVSIYRRALIYNTSALMHLRRNEYVRAERALRKAEQAATQSKNRHAQGLVAHARALHQHETMRVSQEFDPTVEKQYQRATELLQAYPGPLREVYYDFARYKRDVSHIYTDQGNHELSLRNQEEAIQLLDQAIKLPGISEMLHADLLESQATVLNIMQRFTQAAELLDTAETILSNAIVPAYGQVVCGKIALQRSFIALNQDHTPHAALRLAMIAIARAKIFGPTHRDLRSFERVIEQMIRHISQEVLRSFQAQLDDGQIVTAIYELPYHRPPASPWVAAWNESVKFMRETIAIELEA